MKTQTYRLADVIDGRDNNFGLIRLLAALSVMFGHSFWMLQSKHRYEPILKFTRLEYSGSLAVYTFFLVSGMLVSASYARQKSLPRFAALRLGRIYPALFVCVLLTAYLLYPVLQGLGPVQALSDPHAWRYFSVNASVFFGLDRSLPGLFHASGIPMAVNGALWTLPIEMKCYGLVAIAGLLGAFRSRIGYLIASAGVLTLVWALVKHPLPSLVLAGLARNTTGYSFYPVCFFAFGMALYAIRERVVLAWPGAIALITAYLSLRHTAWGQPALYAALVYGVLWLSATKHLRLLDPSQDFSYGIYLYGFPIQQMVAQAWPTMDNLLSLLISVPCTVAVAAGSWFLVEKPAMEGVRHLLHRRPRIHADIASRHDTRPKQVHHDVGRIDGADDGAGVVECAASAGD